MATSPSLRTYLKRLVNFSAAFVLALSSVAFLPSSTAIAAPATFCSAGMIKTFDTNFNWTFKDWGWGGIWSNWTGSQTQLPVTVSAEGTGGNWWGTPTLPDGPDSDWSVSVASTHELAGVRANYGRSGVKELSASGQFVMVDGSRGHELQALNVCVKQLDTTPPVISYSLTPAPNASSWNNTSTYLDWTVTDNQSSVTLQGCIDQMVNTEGTLQFSCAATSTGGSTSQVATVRIDKTKPVIGYTVNPTSLTNGNVTVDFTCTDERSGIAVNSLVSQIISVNGTVYSGDGCIDNAGNIANPVMFNVTNIDKVAPTVSIKTNTGINDGSLGKNPYYSRVSFKLYDQAGNLQSISLNGHAYMRSGTWNDLNWVNINKTHLVQGENTVIVTDKAGNVSSLTFVYDTVAPTITVKTSAPASIGSITGNVFSAVHFKLYDQYKINTWKVNGGALHTQTPNTWSDANNIKVGSNGGTLGENTIYVTDQAGNIATYIFELDNIAPVVTVNSLSTTDSTPELTGDVSDVAADVTVTINGIEYVATNNGDGKWSIELTDALSVGLYSVLANAVDEAGNEAEATGTVTVSALPIVTPVTPAGTNQPTALAATTSQTGILADSTVADSGEDVLGEQTPKDEDDQDVAGTSDDQTDDEDNAGDIFGLAWYWWLAILAALAGLGWLIAAYLRRRDEQEA